MIETDNADRRKSVLGQLGGIEETAFFVIDGERINAVPEQDADRTTADGKASSVQFRFRAGAVQVSLGFGHPRYGDTAVLPQDVLAELANDFD